MDGFTSYIFFMVVLSTHLFYLLYGVGLLPIQAHLLYHKFTLKGGAGLSSTPLLLFKCMEQN